MSFMTEKEYNNICRKVSRKIPFKCVAIFTGTDGSLDFRNGQQYNLYVEHNNEHILIKARNAKFCLYSSVDALLRNWEIKNIEDVNTI